VIHAAGAIVLELPGLLSTTEVRRSQAAERAENASLALAWAAAAVGAEPWGASPYEQRALVLESVGELDRAATDEHRAISREPYNFRHWLLLARMETERGDLTAAVVDYNRARQLDPYGLVFEYAPRANTPPSR
jgi:tetratricopeptide (TPR) repeat protein